MMGTSLKNSPYSYYFKVLTVMGVWILDTSSPFVRNAYVFFGTLMTAFAFSMCSLLYVDFYMTLGDVKKMTWNLSISMVFTGWLLKQLITLRYSDVVNSLRKRLHKKATSRGTPHDEQVNRLSEREYRKIEIVYNLTAVISIPVWLLSLYFGIVWGEREIPLPLWMPFEVDYEDEFQFNVTFVIVSVLAVVAIIFIMAVELSVLTILIQISREYDRLTKDFARINELYEGNLGGVLSGREVNPHLREIKIKRLLKEFIIRQQELIEYTRDFELSYRYPMLIQLLVSSFGLIVGGLQCLTEEKITMKVVYEFAYLFIIVMDMLLFCSYATRIRSQCYGIGEAAYSVLWYRMGVDVQKNICMIIRRSQHPPKIASGKMIEMDLHAFIIMIRNVYSWLTLFNHVAFKSD